MMRRLFVRVVESAADTFTSVTKPVPSVDLERGLVARVWKVWLDTAGPLASATANRAALIVTADSTITTTGVPANPAERDRFRLAQRVSRYSIGASTTNPGFMYEDYPAYVWDYTPTGILYPFPTVTVGVEGFDTGVANGAEALVLYTVERLSPAMRERARRVNSLGDLE